jgi:beta-phosphoglucomutase-like phosphatase (HAD superfamily)
MRCRPSWRQLDALEKNHRYTLRLTDQPQDDDGENTPNEVQDSESKRVQANFDDMFKGMPSIDEIFEDSDTLKGGAEILDVEITDVDPDNLRSRRKIDDTWFETIKVKIESKYADIKEKMLKELEEQRLEDPESVPDNAQLVMETIWQMEMEEEIAAVREKAAKELLAEYERNELEYIENRDLSDMEGSETAQRLKKELREEKAQQEVVQARIDEFVRYEEESFRRAAEKEVAKPDAGKNLDDWALERLEEMLSTQDALSVTDNLEESIEELRSRIEREKKRGSIRPETLKEWQMYRSIATRMLKNRTSDAEGSESQPVDDEGAISSQLESWKKFQEKEKSIRRKSGLTTGPKMPFEWHRAGNDALSNLETSSSQAEDKRSRAEIRAELNRKAIEAMEGMLRRNEGTSIRESLKGSIEALKLGIEADEAAEVENDKLFESVEATGPVDISAIFHTSESSKQTFSTMSKESVENVIVTPPKMPSSTAPSDTPVFSGADDDVSTTSASSSPPPDTPFFSDDGEDVISKPEILVTSKLGTFDEQKLRAMYRKAGAVTADEQENIKQQWEEFRNMEKQKRDISGLSDTDDSGSLGNATLNYDIADVLKDDGDINVEKVMSKIGPRPTRSKKVTSDVRSRVSVGVAAASSASVTEESAAGSSDDSKVTARKGQSELDSEDIAQQVFRSISAIGGGRTKDNSEAKAKEMAAFQEFVRKEDEYRETLDFVEESLTNSTLDELGIEETIVNENIDDDTYVKEVLAAVGPRPKRERKLSPTDAERVYSDTGGFLSDDDEDDDDEIEDDDIGALSAEDELVPEWLRGEKGTRRQAGSSDRGDDEEYEKNMRQLREYEQRRASNRPKQMGIDISDVLGGGMFSDDEYDKYAYDDNVSRGWERGRSFSSFDSRKRNLLDYTELTVQELNLLMDNKDSVLATGVSQYTPRINKPFRAFGAIFRLEGVLLDVTGFHYEAWKKTAEVHGFDPPRLEDVRFAAVTDAEIAARKVFFWTDDFLFCKDIARTHRSAMRDTFSRWMEENGISYSESKEEETRNAQEAVASTAYRAPVVAVESEAGVERQLSSWILTAERFGFTPPSLDEVIFASVISADDAVVNAFRWTADANRVSEIVTAYQGFLAGSADPEMSAHKNDGVPDRSNAVEPFPSADPSRSTVTGSISSGPPTTLSENDILEIQYKAWLTIAEDRNFDPPTPDEALGAMVINDVALVIRDGFAWTDDPLLVQELVREYQKLVGKFVRELSGITASPEVDSQAEASKEIGKEMQKPTGPTMEELQEMKIYAWAAAAEKYDYDASFEQVQAAIVVDPEEAITRVFGWTQFDDVVRDLISTYRQELEKLAGKYHLKAGSTITKIASPSQSQSEGPSNGELFQTAFDAWKEVAENRGFPAPNADQVQFSMTVGPEDGLSSLQWTEDPNERKDILQDYIKAVQEKSSKWRDEYTHGLDPKPKASPVDDEPPPYSIVPEADKWLQSLLDVEMACGVISYLEQDQMDVLLEQAGLDKFFPRDKCVSAGNGYKLESQQMLGAALRIERRPDHCVVFGPTPESSVAAHDVDMKSVAMVGVYPMYELLNSDSTARYFDELTAMNVRRLFGERVYDQPMMDALADRPEMKKQRKTRFWEEGDRV